MKTFFTFNFSPIRFFHPENHQKVGKFPKKNNFWAKFLKSIFGRDPFLDGSVTVMTGNP